MDNSASPSPPPSPPTSERTELLYGHENIIKKTIETFSWTKEKLEGSYDNAGPAIHMIKPIWDGLVQLKEKGVKIRVVTEITADNISYCKRLLEVCELRHLDGVRTNFGIVDGKQALLHGVSQEANPLSQAILTSVKGLVEAQEYLFENLWKSAIPAQHKIKEIEEGVKPPFIETLRNSVEIQKLGLELVKSAKQEIQMLLLPGNNSNTFLSEERRQVIIQLFIVAMLHGIRVRILTSDDMQEQIEKLIEGQKTMMNILSRERKYEQQEEGKEDRASVDHAQGKFEVHLIDKLQQQQRLRTKVSFLIVDSKVCLIEDLKVYNANYNSNEALSLATYSNSESTVLSYISIFETLWATRSQRHKQ